MDIYKAIFSHLFRNTSISSRITVNDPSFYKDVLTKGSLGLGDSYIKGKWDCDCIDEVVFEILQSGVHQKLSPIYDAVRETKSRLVNLQDRKGSKKVIEEHYDLPAEFYAGFLDPFFQYTCGYFDNTNDLNQAQINKMHLICKKLMLNRGERVLDIGGGWGGLAQFMAEEYGARPVVVTLSKTQADYIRKNHGDKIEVWECDYRDIPSDEQFDAVSAVGVFEHIGHKNYRQFMEVVHQSLKQGGRFLLHTLYTPDQRPAQNSWVDKHIFPNSELPPLEYIRLTAKGLFNQTTRDGFQELTPHYYHTIKAWNENLNRAVESDSLDLNIIPNVSSGKMTKEEEHRKWQFYLLSYAGCFKADYVKVGQCLFEK